MHAHNWPSVSERVLELQHARSFPIPVMSGLILNPEVDTWIHSTSSSASNQSCILVDIYFHDPLSDFEFDPRISFSIDGKVRVWQRAMRLVHIVNHHIEILGFHGSVCVIFYPD